MGFLDRLQDGAPGLMENGTLASPGKMATDPPVSEKQRRAMYAAREGHSTLGIPKKVGEEFVGKAHDATVEHASGILFVAPNGDILTLRRSGDETNYAGHWALPGGKGEDGESPHQTAGREAKEEMGDAIPNGKMKLLDARETPTGMTFFTFAQPVGSKFTPKLNSEHSGYAWAPMHQLPSPLHPGVSSTLSDRLLGGKTSNDMSPEDWKGLREGFSKWVREEEQEEEHAEDALPGVAQRMLDGAKRNQVEEWAHESPASVAKHHNISEADARALVNKCREIERDRRMSWSDSALDTGAMDKASVFNAKQKANYIALDKESVRKYDTDGRLHIARTPISKANICPYYGNEIPGGEALGLEPDKIYRLLRHPDELAKAAATSNNQPLLDEHIPTTADEHATDNVVGSTGTDAEFEDPYLYNSLVIWPRGAITGVEKNQKRELSSAYHYEPDMTPGVYKGEAYDGVMRNIRFNHVALVKDGRAGNDVLVMDEEISRMDFTPFTPAFDFKVFKPVHIAFDAFTPEGYANTKNQPTGTVINKGEPWTHPRTDGKGISKDAEKFLVRWYPVGGKPDQRGFGDYAAALSEYRLRGEKKTGNKRVEMYEGSTLVKQVGISS